MPAPERPARLWLAAACLLLAACSLLWFVAPLRPCVATVSAFLRRPEIRLSDRRLRGLIGSAAWVSCLIALGALVEQGITASRDGRRRGPHATMTTATLGGAVSDGDDMSRRRSRPPTSVLGDRERAEMPDERAPSEPTQRPARSPSVLATAALLAARRRWAWAATELADKESSTRGDGSDGARAEAASRTGTPSFVMPPLHLEDPEWSRAVLGLVSEAAPTSRVAAVTLRPTVVEVALVPPSAPSPPFAAGPEDVWLLERSSGMLAELPSTPSIVAASRRAALVSAWTHEGSRALINLLGCRSVALDGPPVAVGTTLSDVVVELATRRWCDLDELVVTGFGPEIAGLEEVVCLRDANEALDHLNTASSDRRQSSRVRCVVVGPGTARARKGTDPLRALVELVHAMPEAGIICCDPGLATVRAVWQLSSHREARALLLRQGSGDRLIASPTYRADPGNAHRRGDARAVAFTHATARMGADPTVRPPAVGAAHWGPRDPSSAHEPVAASPDDGVVVRVLGPVDVQGSRTSFDRRPRVTELVVYLAMHPNGCSGESIASAVWPERRVPAQTLANRLSEARRALGETSLGVSRLRRVSGRHVLDGDVTTDWSTFERLTDESRADDDIAAALSLVRGRPFEGLSEGGWVLLEGLASTIEARVVEAACRLALHELDRGRAARAEWAARRALVAAPWDERLYRILMLASHAAGNRGGIESALRSLARVLEWDGEPLEVVHPETATLYRRLRHEGPGDGEARRRAW